MQEIPVYPSMLSDLLKELQGLLNERGDMPVAVRGPYRYRTAKVTAAVDPVYWDGGCLYPTQNTRYHVSSWVRSKTNRLYPFYCFLNTDEPEPSDPDEPDNCDTIDGQLAPPLPD